VEANGYVILEGVRIMTSQLTVPFETDTGKEREPNKILAESEEKAHLFHLLHECLNFETLLARLSATFINLRATEVDGHIDRGLQLLVEYLDIDRSSVAEFSEDGRELLVTHSYTRPGFASFPKSNIALLLPWYTAKIRQGELLRFSRLPEELPPEAVHEREYYSRASLPQSHLAIPFKVGHSVLGGLGCGSFRKAHEWPGELVQSLKLVAEIFANALARKRAEERETRLREQLVLASRVSLMGELAASIAHEVNQPLCAIISNAQTARRMLADDRFGRTEVDEALEDIARDGQRASAVITRIRGLFNKAPVERSAIDLNELIREVVNLTRWEMNRRGVLVKLDLADKLPSVLGDRVQLQQVILNLMSNGADAMENVVRQKRELVIRTAKDRTGSVLVAVKDRGAGIDVANSHRLFDSFFTTKPGGMGMGLAICKSITESHGGTIWANRNADEGSTFQFTLAGIQESVS
jgi:signal transduction histidine kinase